MLARLHATSSCSRRRPAPHRRDFWKPHRRSSPRCFWAARRTPALRDRRNAPQAAWRELDSATSPSQRLVSAFALHAVDLLGARECSRAYVGAIALDRSLDHLAKISVTADEICSSRLRTDS